MHQAIWYYLAGTKKSQNKNFDDHIIHHNYLEVDLAPSRWGFTRIENDSSRKASRCEISREMFLPFLASFDARFMRDLCEMYEIFMQETTSQARFKCPKKIKVLKYRKL
jgi:hypothetical protein